MGRPIVLKRPEEATNHKSEKTAEFVIPDLSIVNNNQKPMTHTKPIVPTMGDVPPPVTPLQAKVVEEKKEVLSKLSQEIEESKKLPERKVDEMTVVFNLRQLEMEQKTKDLEAKKIKVERELNHMLSLKNSKFHEELKIATETLIDETKKIAPLEKSLEGLVDSIQKIRLEMIRLFNQGLEERKKSIAELGATKVEVTKMSGLVQETVGDLSLAYRDILSASKRTLNDFETDSVKLLLAKQELETTKIEKDKYDFDLSEIQRKIELYDQNAKAVEAKIEVKQNELDGLIRKNLESEERVRSQEAKISNTSQKLNEVEALVNLKKIELSEAQSALKVCQAESENFKVSLDILKGTIERKEKSLHSMDDEANSYSKRVQELRNTEVELLKVIGVLETSKAVTEGELSGLESKKAALVQAVDHMKHLYDEQKRHLELLKSDLNQRFKTEEDRCHIEHQHKIHDWELQFTEHCLNRKAKLTKELEEMSLAHSVSLVKLKDGFVVEAKKSVLDILDINEFSSREERIASMQSAFDTAASKFVLSPIVNHSLVWKKAFWCTSIISFALTGLLIWKW